MISYVFESVIFKFFKLCLVLIVIRDKDNEELQRLEKEGVIEFVQFVEWVVLIVFV